MKNVGSSKDSQKQITSFLVIYRWTTLLFSLMVIFIQDGYRLRWDLELIFFVVLLIYNGLLTFFYSEIMLRNIAAKFMTFGDTILSVFVVTLTGELTGPYFFYSLSAIFAHAYLYEIRGAVEGVIAYILSFLAVSLIHGGGRSLSIDSMGSVIIFAVQGILFGIFCGIPSMLLHQLDKKSRKLDESRKNLLYLHEVACMLKISQSIQEMVRRLMEVSRKIFKDQEIYICSVREEGIQVFGVPPERDREDMERALGAYMAEWENMHDRAPYYAEGMTLIPISRNFHLDGLICLKEVRGERISGEDAMLYTVLANMISSYLENSRLVEKMKEALLLNERNRIARDMHDGLAQSLFFVNGEMQNCRRLLERKEGRMVEEKLTRLQRQIADSLQEVRRYIHNLRNDSRQSQGLEELLGDFLEKIKNDFPVTIDYCPRMGGELDAETAETLFRLAQEGIHNILKHAEATYIRLELEVGDEIILKLADNGRGFDVEETLIVHQRRHTFGLQSMRERVESLGGHFHIESELGAGTSLHIVIPNYEGGKKHGYHQAVNS